MAQSRPCTAIMLDVSVGSFASVWRLAHHFRSTLINGHSQSPLACPFGANLGHPGLPWDRRCRPGLPYEARKRRSNFMGTVLLYEMDASNGYFLLVWPRTAEVT